MALSFSSGDRSSLDIALLILSRSVGILEPELILIPVIALAILLLRNMVPSLGELEISEHVAHPYGGINIYSKEFTTHGKALFDICSRLLSIEKSDNILDIGCGTGRVLNHLSKTCKATGFEINEKYGRIAQERNNVIIKDYYNAEFNNKSSNKCHVGYTGFNDKTFNKTIGIALLNHQTPQDAKIIIEEALRITKKNGLILFTIFLINKFVLQQLHLPEIVFKFQSCGIDHWATNVNRPNLNSAFDESVIRKTIISHGGQLINPVFYGQWRGLTTGLTGHDIIVIRKS